MRFTKEERRGGTLIDITPLVDTVFNLMIFFALSLNFLALSGLKITLPKGATREILSSPKAVDISITREGVIYIQKEEVSWDKVEEVLFSMRNEGYEKVIIKADKDIKHGIVVEILDSAKRSGFTQLAIATTPKEK